jgi:hypothetical protein
MLGEVNVVSAPVVAKERGMVVDEVTRAAQSDYESLITVTVTTERQERSVSGTVYHGGKPRLVDIKGYPDRRRIRQVDDLRDQRGQAGLHRQVRGFWATPRSTSRPSISAASSWVATPSL